MTTPAPDRPRVLVAAGAAGLIWLAAQGLLFTHRGWAFGWLTAWLGAGPSLRFG